MNHPERTAHNPITEGVIWKQILLYFFPLLLSAFFQQLYNTADAVIVGRAAGKEALSAVGGSAGSVLGIFITFFIGFSGGAAVLAAQYYGAKNRPALREAFRASFLSAGGLGLAGALICLVFASPVLGAMNTPADVIKPALWYLRIASAGMLPCSLYNMGASALRAIGDVKRPLAVLVFSCFFNIALDILFVVVLKAGAPGAALATVLCQFLSALLILWCLKGKTGEIFEKTETEKAVEASGRENRESFKEQTPCHDLEKFSRADSAEKSNIRKPFHDAKEIQGKGVIKSPGKQNHSPDKKAVFRKILVLGLPMGFTEVMYTFANVVLMAAVNTFGTDTAAAYAAYGRIDAIFWMVVGSFGISITTFVGQNYGAGRWDRVVRSIRDCAVMMFIILCALILVLFIGAEPLQSLFVRDPAVVAIGTKMMHFLMPFYVLYIPNEILYGALRGMGDSIAPTVITFFSVCLLRSAWGIIIPSLRHTVNMVLLGFPVTWITSSILLTIYFILYIRRKGVLVDASGSS